MMSKKDYFQQNDINWFEMQKKYMDALVAFNKSPRLNMSSTSQVDSSWLNAMEHWWQAMKPDATDVNADFFEKVVNPCRGFYLMSEQFSKLMEGLVEMRSDKKGIIAFINDEFKKIEEVIETNQNIFNWQNIFDPCEQPIELMTRVMPDYPLFFESLINSVHPEVKKIRDQYLSVPSIGYSRNVQEKIQKMVRLWADYQDNDREYQTTLTRLNHKALELMRKKILRMIKKDEKIKSMRDIYGLWVECNETLYSDYVLSKEYSNLNGRLVNSLMAFKKQNHELNEEILSAMNMPTTKALNTLEHWQYELRKQIRGVEEKLKELQEALDKKNEKKNRKVVKKNTQKNKRTAELVNRDVKKIEEDKTRVVAFSLKKKTTGKTGGSTGKKAKKKTKKRTVNKDIIEIKL